MAHLRAVRPVLVREGRGGEGEEMGRRGGGRDMSLS